MPSKVILEQKQKVVEELADKMKNAAAGVLVKYQGIKVDDDTAMRAELRGAGVEYMVVKNTMTGRACDMVGYGAIKPQLSGMTAIAISKDDPIAPAKVLKKYEDKVESFSILSGFLDGEVIDAAAIKELADIPPKEVLIGKILGSLQSSLYGLVYVLQAKIDKENENASAPADEAAPAVEAAPAQA